MFETLTLLNLRYLHSFASFNSSYTLAIEHGESHICRCFPLSLYFPPGSFGLMSHVTAPHPLGGGGAIRNIPNTPPAIQASQRKCPRRGGPLWLFCDVDPTVGDEMA